MGFLDRFKKNSKPIQPAEQDPPKTKSKKKQKTGDCRCINCHTNFDYDHFIGLCTSIKCHQVDMFTKNLFDMNFVSETGPRQLLLNDQTADEIDEINEEFPIEHKIKSEKHICPQCNQRFYFYACPYCRHPMPRLTREELKNTIAPAGIGFSGKTIYMTVLIHHLLNRGIVKRDLRLISQFLLHEDFSAFKNKYEDLYLSKKLLQATMPGDIPRPYLLKTVTRQRNVEDKKSFTLWYDFSGESFEKESDKHAIIQYFAEVGGVFLFVDPTNSQQIVDLLNIEANNKQLGADAMRDISVLQQISTVLSRAHEEDDLVHEKLFAIIVNKVDLFKNKGIGYFEENSVVWEDSPHHAAGEFCIDDFNRVNQETKNYIKEFHPELDGQLALLENENCSNIGYFAVSALGHEPDIENFSLKQPVKPIRVEDPFYWMLYKMGHLPGSDRGLQSLINDESAESQESNISSKEDDFLTGDSLV